MASVVGRVSALTFFRAFALRRAARAFDANEALVLGAQSPAFGVSFAVRFREAQAVATLERHTAVVVLFARLLVDVERKAAAAEQHECEQI
jgi:hypothetical protein